MHLCSNDSNMQEYMYFAWHQLLFLDRCVFLAVAVAQTVVVGGCQVAGPVPHRM